jgi:hypothetical protein
MATTPQWDAQVARLTAQFPKFQAKMFSDSKFWGWMKRNVMKGATGLTVFSTVYVEDEQFGTDRGVEVLKHEAAHVEDQLKWNILFFLSYFLLLPTVLTMRAFWEWRGYREDLRSIHEQYKDGDPEYYKYITDFYCQWVTSQFTGTMYLWMFPFKGFMYKKCQDFVKSLP